MTSPAPDRTPIRPRLSARADIALRIAVCSAVATLFSEAIWPVGHAPPPHGTVIAKAGSAILLSLLFVCVWDPLKERAVRMVVRAPHGHGEPVGLVALAVAVALGAGLVWVHTVLHHHIDADVGQAFGAATDRGLIVLIVCAFWFSARERVWLRGGLAVALVAVIALVGQALMHAGITHEGWTASEIVWTTVPCGVLLFAERFFRPWRTRSASQAAAAVLTVGAAVIGLTGVMHLVNQVAPLPSLLLYSGNVGDPGDWAGTMLDNLFFYAGWAAGLVIVPDISGDA